MHLLYQKRQDNNPQRLQNKTINTAAATKHTTQPFKHLPFAFYLIANHSNYISNLNLPKNLAKLCTEIESKNKNKYKNKTKNLHTTNLNSHQENTHLLHLLTKLLYIAPP